MNLYNIKHRDLIMILKPTFLYLGYQEEKELLLEWLALGDRIKLSTVDNVLKDEYKLYHNVQFFNQDEDKNHNKNARQKQRTLLDMLRK